MNIFRRLLNPVIAAITPRRIKKAAEATGTVEPGPASGKHRNRGVSIKRNRKRDAMQKRSRRINYGLEV